MIAIFAQPRSGSTFLQRALNQCSELLIYGEHRGFIRDLAASYYSRVAIQPPNKFSNGKRRRMEVRTVDELRDPNTFSTATHSDRPLGEIQRDYVSFLKTTLDIHHAELAQVRFGFKEIRYGMPGDRTFYFLNELFPHLQVIFLIRRPTEQILHKRQQVGWWPAQSIKEDMGDWLHQVNTFMACQMAFPQKTRMLFYEELKENEQVIEEVAAWLGIGDFPLFKTLQTLPVVGQTDGAQVGTDVERELIDQYCETGYRNCVQHYRGKI